MIGDNADNTGNMEKMMDYNKLKKWINYPDDKEVPCIMEDKTDNTDSLENANNTREFNNENNIEGGKKREKGIIINSNTDSRGSEINRTNSLPVGINNTGIKCSWAEETEKADIVRELLKEDTKKTEIIEDLIKEREKLETKLRNKNKLIQNLIKEKHEGMKGKINIEASFNKGTQIRNIKTRVNKIKWQLDIKNIEIRDICDEVGDLLSELDKRENLERPLEYNRTRENKFQNQATHNMNIFQVSSGSNETRDNNYQNNYKTHEGKDYNWRKLPCRLHGPGHTAGECRAACGFCLLKGSHTGESCWWKSEKINEFIEKWTQTHGVAAKITAESFIKMDGIIHPTKEEFEKRLNQGKQTDK